MLYKENPITSDWLCWIPDTPQAYYCSTKKKAKEFCDKVNKAFDVGELKFGEDGRIVKVADVETCTNLIKNNKDGRLENK